jgi:serine protease inhibitor
VIKVDEKGTTAAAVTVMMAAGSSMPLPTEPFEMVCDRPFVFVLTGNTYDGGAQVLFTGMVCQP